MKKSLLLFSFLLFILTLFISCGNALDDKCGSNWSPAAELEQEINDLTSALTTYSQDPTTANCEAYRDAYQDYIDALRDWEDCYIHVGLKDEYNQSLDDTQQALDELDCE